MQRGFLPLAAALGVLSTSAVARGACAVRGEHAFLGEVSVGVGKNRWKLIVEDVMAVAHPERLALPVDVLGQLRFRSSPDTIPYVLQAPVVSSPVQMGVGVALSRVRSDRQDLLVDVSLEPVVMHGIAVPCRAVSLDAVPAEGIGANTLTNPVIEQKSLLEPAAYHPVSSSWLLSQGPGSGAQVRIDGDLELFRLLGADEGNPRWVHVVASHQSVALDGWVRRDAIEHASRGGVGLRMTDGTACTADWRRPMRKVRGGSFVYDKPGGGAWAIVAQTTLLEVGEAERGWVPLRRVSGVSEVTRCVPLDHAWIAASSLAKDVD